MSAPNHLAPGRWRTVTRTLRESFHRWGRNDTGFVRVEAALSG